MVLLNQQNLDILSKNIKNTPKYDRKSLPKSIVHIGLGNFHRAHQAFYLHELSNLTQQKNWGLCGVEIRPNPIMEENFRNQDFLYSLIMKSKSTEETAIVGSIVDYVYAANDTSKALDTLCAPETRIVTLTVTENGYNQDKTTGNLNFSDPDIVHDLSNQTHPKTAVGLISRSIQKRKKLNLNPFTVMCCDNLSENGQMVKKVILQFCEKLGDTDLCQYIKETIPYPNSMVDRITPARSPKNESYLKSQYDLEDKIPVMSEDFIQWVIEDKFVNGRPEWEKLPGVTIVKDVVPYELVKLRILNAGHFALSYPAALEKIANVDDAMNCQHLEKFVSDYMDSVIPSLPKNIPGINIQEYKAKVIERFKNPAISDKIERLLKDGSSKMSEYVCDAVRFLVENNLDYSQAIKVIACMIRGYAEIKPETVGMTISDDRYNELEVICSKITSSFDKN